MQRVLKLTLAAIILAFAPGWTISAVAEQSHYPARQVKIIMPLGPGNSLEIGLRMVADKLSAALGQPFVIEAQPGAAGQIGTERAAKAPSDGYTLLAANDGIITMLPNLQKNVAYDPIRDFSPITQVVGIPFVLIAHPSLPAKTAQELVQLAKSRPGQLEFSSGGNGSAQQLAMELFMSLTATKFTHVPYRGAPQAAMDVVSGHIPVALAGVPIVAALINEGKLRAIGVATDERIPILPNTPTLVEQGIPLNFVAWGGLFAPAGTPTNIVHKLSQETSKALSSPDVQARMAEFGLQAYGNSPEKFAETVRTDFARMAKVIRDAGLGPQ
jgi:tripartite-type tricarboxylate transporter receptor subunit TctC